jgi:mRNA-degrading endonuclease YafQ of YafQ-DinJ toxin-antitoxin module
MRKFIQRTKKFEKSFSRIPKNIQNRFIDKLTLFIENEFFPSLKTHPLKGDLQGHFSFSVTDDVRVVYKKRVYKDKEFIIFFFMDIGGHERVY